MRRGPETETLEYGDDDRPPSSDDGLLAHFVDWYLERPKVGEVLGPLATLVVLGIVVVLAADLAVLVGRETARPATSASASPTPLPSPSRPPPPPEVVAERARIARSTARFAASLLCDDRIHVSIRALSHNRYWSEGRFLVVVAGGTPQEGRLEVDVEPFDIGVSYQIASASGTCRRN